MESCSESQAKRFWKNYNITILWRWSKINGFLQFLPKIFNSLLWFWFSMIGWKISEPNAKTEWRNIDWLGYYEQLKSLIKVDPVYGTEELRTIRKFQDDCIFGLNVTDQSVNYPARAVTRVCCDTAVTVNIILTENKLADQINNSFH